MGFLATPPHWALGSPRAFAQAVPPLADESPLVLMQAPERVPDPSKGTQGASPPCLAGSQVSFTAEVTTSMLELHHWSKPGSGFYHSVTWAMKSGHADESLSSTKEGLACSLQAFWALSGVGPPGSARSFHGAAAISTWTLSSNTLT